MLLRRTAMLELRRVVLVPRCRDADRFSCGRAAATRHAASNAPSSCRIYSMREQPSASCASGSHSSTACASELLGMAQSATTRQLQ